MKNRKNRLISARNIFSLKSGIFFGIFCVLFAVSPAWMSETYAQVPADFIMPADTVYVMGTPTEGGKQIIDTLGSLQLKINLTAMKYSVVAFTPNAMTFNKFARFSTVTSQVVDAGDGKSVLLELRSPQCLVLVPKGPNVTSRPFARVTSNSGTKQQSFYDIGNYYYLFITPSSADQKFVYNVRGYNSDISFYPQQNKTIVWNAADHLPRDKLIMIETTGPFK